MSPGKQFLTRMRGTEPGSKEEPVAKFLYQLWSDERGQDVAEYAVMLAVVLVIVVGTIRLIGANANNVFSSVASSISQ
jgi:Flp pilus assembly pilin Flp